MAHITADRVKQISTSTGTGTFVLSSSITGFRTFASVLAVSDTFWYAIAAFPGSEWEVGLGTYSAANTITRTTVLASSNAGSAVTFSAGDKEVFITAAASKFLQQDSTGSYGNFTAGTITGSGLTITGTSLLASSRIRTWTATDTDIDGLISGSTTGLLIEGGNSAHFTVGLRSNDTGDGFQVISKGAATTPDTDPFTTLCFEVKANGNLTWAGTATGTSFNSITGLSAVVGTTPGTAAIGTSTAVARADHVHPVQTTISGNAGTATSLSGGSLGTVPYQSAAGTTAMLAAGTSGYFLKANGVAAPSWAELSLTDLPDAWVKKSVRAATTANITLSAPQTIDGISVIAGDRVLVKDQTTTSQNGVYVVAAAAWSRATDANTASKIAGAHINVDSGTVNGGIVFDTDFKSTDTLDTTAMVWYQSVDTGYFTTVGNNFVKLANPSAITFPRINADNTVSTLDAATFRTAIGAGTSSTTGTVTSVGGTGTVSGLTLTGTVTTTGNLTLGGTLAVTASNFASQTANTFLSAPNGAAGVPTFRAIVAADVPTLNQNTTGSAATLTTSRTLWGQGFTGAANVTGNLTSVGNITGTAGVTLTATAGTLALVATGANIITASNNGSERLRIDSTGRAGIGTISPSETLHVSGTNIRIDGTTGEAGVYMYRANAQAPDMRFFASGGTIATPTASVNSNLVGQIHWQAHDGTTYQDRAGVYGVVDGVVSSGTVPMALRFLTGTTSLVERMRIDSAGVFSFDSGYGSSAPAYGCRAWVNFDGSAAGTFAGGTSTVSRTAGSTTATVTTTTAHGLITGNTVQALTGVAAGVYPVTVLTSTTFNITTAATTVLTAASITFAVSSIRASGNVSSVADNATGDYTVNFATAMVDANYSVTGTAKRITADNLASTIVGISGFTAPTTTSVRVFVSTINSSGWAALDSTHVNLVIHR